MKHQTVDWTRKKIKDIGFKKCGIIPFIIDEHNKIYFCLGEKTKNSSKLTDFSDDKVMDDKDIIGTGIRACRHLSLGIFSLTQDSFEKNNKLYLFDRNYLLILNQFKYIPNFKEFIKVKFNEKGSLDHPISELKWFEFSKLFKIVNSETNEYHLDEDLRNLLSELSLISSIIRY